MTVQEIVKRINKNRATTKPTIIAIDGFGGAGKSTFATMLKDYLGSAYIVEIDDFFLKDVISDAHKSNFDRARLKKQVLIPLREGRVASYQKLEWDFNKLSEFYDIPAVEYVIIEGVSSFHPDIEGYIDYKIWIDTPADTAKKRMIDRDRALGNEHGDLWEHWTKSFQEYKDLYKPETRADSIISGNT